MFPLHLVKDFLSKSTFVSFLFKNTVDLPLWAYLRILFMVCFAGFILGFQLIRSIRLEGFVGLNILYTRFSVSLVNHTFFKAILAILS